MAALGCTSQILRGFLPRQYTYLMGHAWMQMHCAVLRAGSMCRQWSSSLGNRQGARSAASPRQGGLVHHRGGRKGGLRDIHTVSSARDQSAKNEKFRFLLDTEGLSTSEEITPDAPLTPWTLYRFMMPPSARLLQARDIAFAGVLLNFTTAIIAHVSSALD